MFNLVTTQAFWKIVYFEIVCYFSYWFILWKKSNLSYYTLQEVLKFEMVLPMARSIVVNYWFYYYTAAFEYL